MKDVKIFLHQYPGAFALPSLSPFCLKVEYLLQYAKIPYQVKTELNPLKGPKGKMPFIVDELRNKTIADSSFIFEYIFNNYSLDHLIIQNKVERGNAFALKTMIEESLYFVLLASRWFDPQGFNLIKKNFSSLFPLGAGALILPLLRFNLVRQGKAQGTCRHQLSEIFQIGVKQINILSDVLGHKKFFYENKITEFDFTCYAFLITFIKQPINNPIKDSILKHENLMNYLQTMDELLKK
jgi:glutathione S-transferase